MQLWRPPTKRSFLKEGNVRRLGPYKVSGAERALELHARCFLQIKRALERDSIVACYKSYFCFEKLTVTLPIPDMINCKLFETFVKSRGV